MNKAIIIVDAFLYSQERIELFKKVLKKINQIDLPILLISNSTISEDIQKQLDYFIYDKSNILFEYEYESYPFCNNFLATEHFIWEQHIDTKQKHGLSVLCNLTKAYDFATKQGFNKFIRLEWDFLIHEDDLNKIKNLIHDFINSNQKAFFVLNPFSQQGNKEITYHFWMVDSDFWNAKFPKIHSETDYQNFMFNKNNNKKFEIVERFSYLVFEDIINEITLIIEEDFCKTIVPNSSINAISTDTTFLPPSELGINRGLGKVWKNGGNTGEFVFMTVNRMNKNTDVNDYYLTFDNQTQHIHHEVEYQQHAHNFVKGLNFSNFPVTLNVNNKFKKTYNSPLELRNIMILL